MNKELKPCPFCAGRALPDYDEDNCPIIHCQSCCCTTDWFEKIEEAIKAWNKRVECAECKKNNDDLLSEEFAKEEVVKQCITCKYWASVNGDDDDGECGIGRGQITREHYCADHTTLEKTREVK